MWPPSIILRNASTGETSLSILNCGFRLTGSRNLDQSAKTVPTILGYISAAVDCSRSLSLSLSLALSLSLSLSLSREIRHSVTEQSSGRLDGEFAGRLCGGAEWESFASRRRCIFAFAGFLYFNLVAVLSCSPVASACGAERQPFASRRRCIFAFAGLLYFNVVAVLSHSPVIYIELTTWLYILIRRSVGIADWYY